MTKLKKRRRYLSILRIPSMVVVMWLVTRHCTCVWDLWSDQLFVLLCVLSIVSPGTAMNPPSPGIQRNTILWAMHGTFGITPYSPYFNLPWIYYNHIIKKKDFQYIFKYHAHWFFFQLWKWINSYLHISTTFNCSTTMQWP